MRYTVVGTIVCPERSCRDPLRWLRGTLYAQNLALTSPTSGIRSVGIVRSRTQATEFFFVGSIVYNLLTYKHYLFKLGLNLLSSA
jgi:hypothetical protein